jgi:hypothetical protein
MSFESGSGQKFEGWEDGDDKYFLPNEPMIGLSLQEKSRLAKPNEAKSNSIQPNFLSVEC